MDKLKKIVRDKYFRILLLDTRTSSSVNMQKGSDYLEWTQSDLVEITNDFYKRHIHKSHFLTTMNGYFKTSRFPLLAKRWIMEYFLSLFDRLYEYSHSPKIPKTLITIEDNPINRYGFEKYCQKFNLVLQVKWIPRIKLQMRLISMLIIIVFILYLCINSGVKLFGRKKKFKVLREALWGMEGRGYFFHDDFIVDEIKIKKQEILFFGRQIMKEHAYAGRFKAYNEAKNAGYKVFFLPDLKLGFKQILFRIIPKYIIGGSYSLLLELRSQNFSLFENIFHYFILYAIPYEKVFSNFEIISELGHNYFSASHIAEAIVCQNFGVKYYLMHWSDISCDLNKTLFSFLGCDNFLMWGKAHGRIIETEDPSMLRPVGYVFKKFIGEVTVNKAKILSDMSIRAKGKIISFFDEPFCMTSPMTEEHFVEFWKIARDAAVKYDDCAVILKPKDLNGFEKISDKLKNEFLEILDEIKNLPNVFIIDSEKWSFIEVIGVSDLVITQGMSSSATIALICGIEGLYYFDQCSKSHLFFKLFKDKVVFDEPGKLLQMVGEIIAGRSSALQAIPEHILRDYDAYSDNLGIERFREVLTEGVF